LGRGLGNEKEERTQMISETAKKLKALIKGVAPKETFGTDPRDPWSAKANITEASLDQYLKSKGIDPRYVAKDSKIAHAKSGEFKKWAQDHKFEEVQLEDKTTTPSPVQMRKQSIQKSTQSHQEVPAGSQTAKLTPEEVSGDICRICGQTPCNCTNIDLTEGKMGQLSADIGQHIDKHVDEYKKTGGAEHLMSKIDHTTKHIAKLHGLEHKHAQKFVSDYVEKKLHEEKIEEGKDYEVKIDYTDYEGNRGAHTHTIKNANTPKHAKHIAMNRHSDMFRGKHKSFGTSSQGVKELGEDVYQDPQAATQTVFDGANNPNMTEKKRELSKSARMIKAIYKKYRMSEDMYDHEKEDKSVATYGKKPKHDKADKDDSLGENKPTAAATLTGGTTLTGEKRDDIEIDPMMRNRPNQPDVTKKDDKKKDEKDGKKKDEKK
jgi:hypothetical protein